MPPISAVAGKPLAVTCPAAGFPIHAVTWEKGETVYCLRLPHNKMCGQCAVYLHGRHAAITTRLLV